MHRTWRGVALGLALLASFSLAGCGHRAAMHRSASATSAVSPAAPMQVTPPRFSDAHPVPWPGRTPDAYPVHGIDVSRWQVGIDWPTARAHGVNFAFIKATEGGDHADPRFWEHWQAAAQAGVPRAAYHFYYFCRPAAEQAAWFIQNVPRERGMLPPILDMEWNAESETCPHRPDPATVRAEMATWLNIVGAHYGRPPSVYTTVDFWHENDLGRVHGFQPWLRAVTRHPEAAYPGADWTFWQYSGTGLIPGIPGEVDLNAFRGSPQAWNAWLAANRL